MSSASLAWIPEAPNGSFGDFPHSPLKRPPSVVELYECRTPSRATLAASPARPSPFISRTPPTDRHYILIYRDYGTSITSCDAIYELASRYFPWAYIRYVTTTDLKRESWRSSTFLLIFPGGECSKWEESMGKDLPEEIKSYVIREFGNVLGFCAGGYWLCHNVQFQALDTVIYKRRLGLVPFDARGPITSDRSVTLKTPDGLSGSCFYRGGGAFTPVDPTDNPRSTPLVLAEYTGQHSGGAVVATTFPGGGKAIAVGPHTEFDLTTPGISHLLPDALTEGEEFRLSICDGVMRYIGEENPSQ